MILVSRELVTELLGDYLRPIFSRVETLRFSDRDASKLTITEYHKLLREMEELIRIFHRFEPLALELEATLVKHITIRTRQLFEAAEELVLLAEPSLSQRLDKYKFVCEKLEVPISWYTSIKQNS
jgi:hypothetical protein